MNDIPVSLPDYEVVGTVPILSSRADRLFSWGLDFLKVKAVHEKTTGEGWVWFVIDTEDDPSTVYLKYDSDYSKRFTNELPSVKSESGHGTHVGDTIQQIAPMSVVALVKALRNDGNGYASWIANAIRYVADLELKPEHRNFRKGINLSLGSPVPFQPLEDAMEYAYDKGVVIVSAAGNGGNKVDYPGAYDQYTLTVSAIDHNGRIASFSDRGPAIDLACPGVGIQAEFRGSIAALSGTSMAAPHLAGIIALAISYNKTVADVEGYMKEHASDAGAQGEDDLYGAGIPVATNYIDNAPEPEPEPEPDPNEPLPTWLIIAIVVVFVLVVVVLLLT